MNSLIIYLIVIFFSIGIHEFVHAKVADMAGDPTPGIHGRVTLNLFKHFDPLGAIFILVSTIAGFGIGWGRPVPMDPSRMRNPRWDHFWAVLCAPLTNLLIAIFAAVLFRVVMIVPSLQSPLLLEVLITFIIANIGLFCFNLVPMGPLDGMWVLGTFLPEKQRYYWTKFNLSYGTFIFLALVLIRIPTSEGSISFFAFLRPIMMGFVNVLTGSRM